MLILRDCFSLKWPLRKCKYAQDFGIYPPIPAIGIKIVAVGFITGAGRLQFLTLAKNQNNNAS